MADFHVIQSDMVKIVFNPEGGHMEDVSFPTPQGELRPLHRAPWRDDGTVPADTPISLKNLAGDFFCAPFCASDIEAAPWHGWTSNGTWDLDEERTLPGGGCTVIFRLRPKVLGATVFKEITLRPGQPIVYQRHRFVGGTGALPVAHHAMINTKQGVKVSFSEKMFGLTPDEPPEVVERRGRSLLAYPQRFSDLSRVRTSAGSYVDASLHPIDRRAEDLIYLADPADRTFAWSAAVSQQGDFSFFALKDPRILSATLLWMSNRGRNYAPWSGRHGDCLGIEEICANVALGHRRSVEPNDLSRSGVATAISLDPSGTVSIPYAFGAIPCISAGDAVAAVRSSRHLLVITAGTSARTLAWDGDFFA